MSTNRSDAIERLKRRGPFVELHFGFDHYLAFPGSHGVELSEESFVRPLEAGSILDELAVDDPLRRSACLQLLELVRSDGVDVWRVSDDWIRQQVRNALADGRIVLLRVPRERLRATFQPKQPAPPPPPPPPAASRIFRYPVTVIEDTGQPVSGVRLKFELAGTPRMVSTNFAGDGSAEWVEDVAGTVRVLDLPGLSKRLKARWQSGPATVSEGSGQRVNGDALDFPVRSGTRTTIVLLRPSIVRTRLIGAFFDTDKSFILPSAMRGIRALCRQYDEHPRPNVLVIGHTDDTGTDDYNETLSVERADAVAAFLSNDADAWSAWFGDDRAPEKRWGLREIQLMLSVLPERAQKPFYEGTPSGRDDERYRDAVSAFQQFSNDQRGTELDVDGKAGEETRPEIIKAYMALQGTSLPDGAQVTTHGCGPYFPIDHPDDAGASQDDEPDSAGASENAENRRVEIVIFEGLIDPPPAGKISKAGASDYPAWLSLVQETIDFSPDEDDDLASAVRLLSVASANRTFPKPSWIPVLADIGLRLIADPSLHVLVVGNCDETGDDGLNRSLSLARANAVRALLLQDADAFRAQFDGAEAGENWDWQEIQWMLSAVVVDGLPCYAGYVDGHRGDETLAALELFQLANDLVPTREADDVTLKTIIEQYQGLLGDEAPEPDQVEVAGGGAGLVPRSFGPESAPSDDPAYEDADFEGFRRIELFLSTKVFEPPPESLDNVSGRDHPSYAAWCKGTVRELPGQTTFPVLVKVTDRFGIPQSASADVFLVADDGSESSAASLSPGARGIARLDLPPGVYAIRFGDDGPDQRVAAVHVRLDEVGGVNIRLPADFGDGS